VLSWKKAFSTTKKMRSNNVRLYIAVVAVILLITALSFNLSYNHTNNSNVKSRLKALMNESWYVCKDNFLKTDDDEKTLFVVTPTYKRLEQIAELTRVVQTLGQVKVLHWIVIEDNSKCSARVSGFLDRHPDMSWTLLSAPMPNLYKSKKYLRKYGLPRGVAGRRAALKWITSRTKPTTRGVLYFADDDNTYDLQLFNELLSIPHDGVGMFPVGLIQPWGISGPIINKKGKVVGFIADNESNREFPVDMAGFGVHVSLLHSKKPSMPYRATAEEDGFLKSLDVK
jgi:hypothetical protein